MRKILALALVALFAGTALAGCAGNKSTNTTTTPGTTTPGGGTGPVEAIVVTSPLSPFVGQSVSFVAQGAGGSDTVKWQFGDGASATGASTNHVYPDPGNYIVRLEVTRGSSTVNNEGALTYLTVASAAVDFANTTAENAAPAANLVIDRQVISKGGNVTANASSSFGWAANPDFNATIGITPDNLPVIRDADATANLTFSLSWGDGSAPIPEATGTHTYDSEGVYVITATVTGANGKSAKESATVLVLTTAPPVGGFKQKELYVTATISGPQSFDPGFDYESAGGNVIEQVYETLFSTERGNSDRITALLAAEVPSVENGGILDGGMSYRITLRQGVKFHDGTDFDANAVKFSFDRSILMNDPSSGAAVLAPILMGARDYRANSTNTQAERDAWLAIEAVKVVDKYTVDIKLDRPNAAFFQRLAFYGTSIVSPTSFKACHSERVALWGVCQTADGLPPASTGGAAITRDPWADTHMVGTGAFKLRQFLPADRVIMDRFDDYYGPKPTLRTVIIQYVDDLNTRILMLRSGEADEIYIPSGDIDRVKPTIQDIARFTPADTLIIDAFFFNYDIEDPELCPTLANGQKDCQFFQDINVRKAFVHAFDYNTFFSEVWKGRARELGGVIPRGMPGYDETLAAYKTDLPKAREALAASNGKDGFTVDCFWNSGNNVRKGACELIKKNLEDLSAGITVNSREIPFNTLLDKTQNQLIPFWVLGWSPDYIATDNYIEPFFHSKGRYPRDQNFKDDEIDAKIEAALRMTDPEEQADAYAAINRLGVERYVHIFLDQRTQTHVDRTYVQGYYYSPLHSGSPNTGDYSTISKA